MARTYLSQLVVPALFVLGFIAQPARTDTRSTAVDCTAAFLLDDGTYNFDLTPLVSRLTYVFRAKVGSYHYRYHGSQYDYLVNICDNVHVDRLHPACQDLPSAPAYQVTAPPAKVFTPTTSTSSYTPPPPPPYDPQCFPLSDPISTSIMNWTLLNETNPEDGVRLSYTGGQSCRKRNTPEIIKVTSPEAFTGERARGCRLNGHVTVGRAPGSMRITPADSGSSFVNARINVSHLVHHLSFGDVKAAHTKHGVKHGSLHPEKAVHALEGAKFSALSGSIHVTHQNVTQEHYLKVVRTEVRRNGVQLPLSASYQYTVTNAQFAEEQESPSAKFSFDLSPMQVMVMEETRSFGHFITSVCAIIGGVFTMIGIFDAVLHHSVRAIEHKMNLNKQN